MLLSISAKTIEVDEEKDGDGGHDDLSSIGKVEKLQEQAQGHGFAAVVTELLHDAISCCVTAVAHLLATALRTDKALTMICQFTRTEV